MGEYQTSPQDQWYMDALLESVQNRDKLITELQKIVRASVELQEAQERQLPNLPEVEKQWNELVKDHRKKYYLREMLD